MSESSERRGEAGAPLAARLAKLVASNLDVNVEEYNAGVHVITISSGPLKLSVGFLDCTGKSVYEAIGLAESVRARLNLDKVVVLVGPKEASSLSELNLGWLIPLDYEVAHRALESGASVHAATVLSKARSYHVPAALSIKDVERIAERHRGLIIRRSEFVGARLAYMPLYCFLVHLHSVDYTPLFLESEMANLCFESATGSLVTFDDGLRIATFWQRVGELGEDAINVLKRIADLGEASIAELREEFKDKVDVVSVVEVLMERGLIEPRSPETYSLAPIETRRVRDPYTQLRKYLREGGPQCFTIKPHVNLEKLSDIVGIFGHVKDKIILYYPLIFIVYTRKAGGRKIEMTISVDGLTGVRLGDIEELIAESPAVSDVDSIVDEVSAEGGIKLCRSY